jgi:hypothetical protein
MDALYRALRDAALPYLDATQADELARNLAGCDPDELTWPNVRASIARRQQHFGLVVADPNGLAWAICRVVQVRSAC